MRLVDFLVLVLEAHGQVLLRLAALLGEEELQALLELDDDRISVEASEPESALVIALRPDWLEDHTLPTVDSPYAELEDAVRSSGLPAQLQFYLWAYPHYRAFIESPLDLDSRIRGAGSDAGVALVNEAVAQAEAWIRKLPLPPSIAPQAERAAQIPWLRFRTNVLKRIGRRPLGPVY